MATDENSINTIDATPQYSLGGLSNANAGTYASAGDDNSSDKDGSPSGGSSGGSGGGGGGGSSASEAQKKAAANLGGIAGWNANTVTNNAKYADETFDISDKQNEYLRDMEERQTRRNASNDWYTQQQRLQSTVGQLREAQGNALKGSNFYDLMDLVARKDDMDDAEVLNNLRENLESVWGDYYKAIMATNNSRNEMYMDTEKGLRDLVSDYVAQMNSILPEEADNLVDKEGHTLKPPDWLPTEYFESHKREAIKPEERGLVRADNFQNGRQGSNAGRQLTNPSLSAGSPDYWSRMYGGYSRRT